MDKFQNKYRITSHRYRGWNYAGDGIYFLTLNIRYHECVLGEIRNKKMALSGLGKIVKNEWLKSFEIRAELFLDEFVVMPNHLHGLIVLENKMINNGTNVETHGRASLRTIKTDKIYHHQNQQTKPEFQRKPKSISSFVAGFKSSSKSKVNDFIDQQNLDISKYNSENKLWQPNYYDHIVRNEKEYWKIKNYIKNNPNNWEIDKFYKI